MIIKYIKNTKYDLVQAEFKTPPGPSYGWIF